MPAGLLLLLLLPASLLALAAGSPDAGPNPLAATGYSPEHGNFICSRFFGENTTGDTYTSSPASRRARTGT